MSGVIWETIIEIKNIKQKARNLIDKLPDKWVGGIKYKINVGWVEA
ncbi:hypothetical protein VL20_2827 [Microcystis panniformis FACHB-1757]|uniref:Mobile element protein n=1 Tax=Microcystis panniformis FACHB-1757 TaxID=1638788 RepID=A0A0K1S1J1_9CHRO|nr:hypothetical protein VL20_2827 [Microcystis panniformis FACHB-1757]